MKDDYSYWSESLHSAYLFYTLEVDKLNKENKRLREALEKIKTLFNDNYPQYDCCMKKDSIHYFQCDKDNTCRYSKDACFYYLAKQALGE